MLQKKFSDMAKWGCIGLLVLGIGLRLFAFGAIPVGLNRDEAALGYNAYSLAYFGVDEWGESWPLVFKSFGDYKLPGYIYTLVPLIRVLGTNDWVIRLPSLMAGLVLIYLMYRLTSQLTKSSQTGLVAAALLSVTPWAIFYSRMAWEAHLGLMWLVMAILLLLQPVTVRRGLGLVFTYGMATATYNTPLLLAPVLMLFILLNKKILLKDRVIYASIILVIAGLIWWRLQPLTAQKQGITIFSDPTIVASQAQRYIQADSWMEKIMTHRVTNYLVISASHLAQSLTPQFLVFQGGSHPWHTVPGTGHISMTVYGLLIFAGVQMFRSQKLRKMTGNWWMLLLLGLFPSVITVDSPHATRSLLSLWLIPVLVAIAVSTRKKIVPVIILLLLADTGWYGYRYFATYPTQTVHLWPRGLTEAVSKARAYDARKIIAVTNHPRIDDDLLSKQLYIYLLLATKTNPHTFAQSAVYLPPDNAGLIRVAGFEGFEIINEPNLVPSDRLLIEQVAPEQYVFEKH